MPTTPRKKGTSAKTPGKGTASTSKKSTSKASTKSKPKSKQTKPAPPKKTVITFVIEDQTDLTKSTDRINKISASISRGGKGAVRVFTSTNNLNQDLASAIAELQSNLFAQENSNVTFPNQEMNKITPIEPTTAKPATAPNSSLAKPPAAPAPATPAKAVTQPTPRAGAPATPAKPAQDASPTAPEADKVPVVSTQRSITPESAYADPSSIKAKSAPEAATPSPVPTQEEIPPAPPTDPLVAATKSTPAASTTAFDSDDPLAGFEIEIHDLAPVGS